MISSQTKQCYFTKKIFLANGIFNMQTSLAIPFTILKTKNYAYFIFKIIQENNLTILNDEYGASINITTTLHLMNFTKK